MGNKTMIYLMLILVLSELSAGCLTTEDQKIENGVIIITHTNIINSSDNYKIINNTNDFPVIILIMKPAGKGKQEIQSQIKLKPNETIKIPQ